MSSIIDLNEIDKILFVHCNKKNFVEIKDPKIYHLKYWDIYNESGNIAKYKAALEPIVTTEAIIFMDDTIKIQKSTCKNLYDSWKTDSTLVHGNYPLEIYYDYKINKYQIKEIESTNENFKPHIILTKLCIVSQKYIKVALDYALNLQDLFIDCDTTYIGIDICLSIITACKHNTDLRINKYIRDLKCTEHIQSPQINYNEHIYSDICTITINKYFNNKTDKIQNNNTIYPEILVVIPFFNFAKYNKLYSNIYETVTNFNEQKVSVVVMEAVLNGEVSNLYTIPCKVITTKTDTIAFHKEGLFNKGFHLYKNLFNMFVLCDSDIIFNDNEWANKLTILYKNGVEAVQPFSKCHWTTKQRKISHSAVSYSYFRKKNEELGMWNKYKALQLRFKYHPGFVWAFSKKFLERTGGVYSKCFTGSGDEIVIFLVEGIIISNEQPIYNYLQPDLNNFLQNCGAKQDAMNGEIYHLYHGSVNNRKYYERHTNIINKKITIGSDYFSPNLEDHLVKAINPKVNEVNLAYFQSRREDD
jgi:hypothetical protein